ncbi:MAG TPA: RnfABCDGE type electron transport complex subunit G [Candidatus Coatesbacteria bacterium]|nr:RnfABCDGE type electron transport complex subunit G [Candidatus Coatesbacteria bacterium]
MLRLGVTLFIVTAVMAAALGLVYSVTKETIAAQEEAKVLDAVALVLPEGASAEAVAKTVDGRQLPDYFVARGPDGRVVGYALVCYGKGFSSTLELMAGFTPDGVITGTSVLKQAETPGLGERVNEVRAEGTLWTAIGGLFSPAEGRAGPPPEPWYQTQYRGLDARGLELVKGAADPDRNQVEAITGATITSRAFTDALRDGVTAFLARTDIPR